MVQQAWSEKQTPAKPIIEFSIFALGIAKTYMATQGSGIHIAISVSLLFYVYSFPYLQSPNPFGKSVRIGFQKKVLRNLL